VTYTTDDGTDAFALVTADYPDKVNLLFADNDGAFHQANDVPKTSDRLK
jgi:hypothetical protein